MEWVAIASAAVGAISSISQGNAAAAAARSQAQALDYNAAVERQNAQIALQQGNANEEAQRRQARRVLGAQRAGLTEAGLSGGTAGDLVSQSAADAELDALNIRYGAQLQATGHLNSATLDQQQARQARKNASAAQTAGYIGAGAAALSGYGGYLNSQARIKAAGRGLLQ